jgi:hypothetical protein
LGWQLRFSLIACPLPANQISSGDAYSIGVDMNGVVHTCERIPPALPFPSLPQRGVPLIAHGIAQGESCTPITP